MKFNKLLIKTYQHLLDYDILKVISEQLRLLAWASPAVWLWFGWTTTSKIKTGAVVLFLWTLCQCSSLLFLKFALLQRKDD